MAFAREAIGRDPSEEERYLQRVLDVIAQVAAIFGAATATDERVRRSRWPRSAVRRATGLQQLPAHREPARAADPAGRADGGVKVGAKLVLSLIAAEGANRVDKAARVRAQLLSRIYGRAAAAVLADAAHADPERRPLPTPTSRRASTSTCSARRRRPRSTDGCRSFR